MSRFRTARVSKRVLVLLLANLPAINQTSTYRIAGQVVRRLDNRIIKSAQVSIAAIQDRNRFISCTTGGDGAFSFSGLAPGKYALRVTSHGWAQDYLQDREFSTAIAVGPGLDSEHIRFALETPGKISGIVVDDGDPAFQAMVYLFTQGVFRGHLETQLVEVRSADTSGKFRFGPLRPGTYYVAIGGRPWYARATPAPDPQQTDAQPAAPPPISDIDVAYPVTYYDDAPNSQSATPLNLPQGGNVQIQFNMHAVPAAHLQLSGFPSEPNKFLQLNMFQRGPGGVLVSIPDLQAGSELQGLAPGDYLLTANLNGANQVDLGSEQISVQAEAAIHPGDFTKTSITGKVVLASGQPTQGMALMLRGVPGGNQAVGWVTPDGSFSISDIVLPGRYELLLANTADSYIRGIKVSGCAYTDGLLDITNGAHIEMQVFLARGLSNVDGVALSGDKPLAAAMVLAIRQGSNEGHVFPRDQSDSDGTFSLIGVPPGRYIVVAIDKDDDLEYADPKVIAPYLSHGQPVDVPLPVGQLVRVQVQHRM